MSNFGMELYKIRLLIQCILGIAIYAARCQKNYDFEGSSSGTAPYPQNGKRSSLCLRRQEHWIPLEVSIEHDVGVLQQCRR